MNVLADAARRNGDWACLCQHTRQAHHREDGLQGMVLLPYSCHLGGHYGIWVESFPIALIQNRHSVMQPSASHRIEKLSGKRKAGAMGPIGMRPGTEMQRHRIGQRPIVIEDVASMVAFR